MEKNPILIIDDDEDDLELIQAAADKLRFDRPIKYFTNGPELEAFLKSMNVVPFLIICDVNLPDKDGFEVKRHISEDEELKYRSVPFIFWSTDASEKQIQQAYDLPAQGFFLKPTKFSELCDTLQTIVDYWQKSRHPKQMK